MKIKITCDAGRGDLRRYKVENDFYAREIEVPDVLAQAATLIGQLDKQVQIALKTLYETNGATFPTAAIKEIECLIPDVSVPKVASSAAAKQRKPSPTG